ncbi:MAG: metal ABC transporter substrate-binding protein [Oscillospiraceae bacterium]|nr:metal ABC transporter substrate-binding protein [Oscillospiraceae bacterium]MCI1989714.1 metal ABC transporter substrate-binding protein [Oscillospiraceae bacterium]MCI2034317.1 metal ABC transporter substrate-binding protein [Oscillospiraceae bacterium]
MLKRCTALLLCAAAVLSVGLSACGSGAPGSSEAGSSLPSSGAASAESKASGGKLKVSVSFNAMKEFTEAVGKEKVEVSTIIPAGTEPHDFEPKAQDLVGLSTAKVFVYSGFGMEAWAEKAVQSANNPDLVTVEASKGAEPIKNTDAGEIKEHGQYDPHIWLSLKGAEIEVKNIRTALVKADPSNQDYYEKNCNDFVSQLEALYTEYKKKFQAAPKKSFVTGHAAFGYLCRDFGLEQNSVEDTFAEGEPNAQQLSELVQYCKQHKVTTIFAEDMASPDVSKTLAQEVGAKVETIYTVEGEEEGRTYLERVKSDLDKIDASLEEKG